MAGSVCGGGVHGRWHVWQGVCMVGGMHGEGCVWHGACMVGGVCMVGHAWWGVCLVGACMAGEMATAAGGMHPTGMHSCLHFFLNFWTNTVKNFPKNTKLMSFLIVPFRFSIFIIEDLKFKWQCSQYFEFNPTCAFSDWLRNKDSFTRCDLM